MSSSLPSQDIESQEAEPRLLDLPSGTRADRLDKVLAQLLPEHSRSRLQGWIERGGVLVNGKAASVRQVVGPGDQLTVWEEAAPESLAFTPEAIDFPVVADSADWIVVDKPVGLVVHPGAGNWHGTLLNGLLHRYPELAQVPRAGIVHRLDKDTSGLMVVARTITAQTSLVRQLQARTVGRRYLALVSGHVRRGGTIDRPIGRDPRVPVRMSVERPIAAKPAITHFEPLRLGRAPGGMPVTEVECRLETGRTHQIRVHMASIGHPLLADTLYGGKAVAPAARQMLHAARLQFDDPVHGGPRVFHAPVPDDMQAVVRIIAWEDGEEDADGYLDEEDDA
ncbi:RluA family pseudouridine synthase [Pigmentiphaga sp. GD03639]|uniref:RluA family pseudouridine synthase n=1 Tax=unclassified Pigmentiphaga TaxID=2626614 RepID=UPI000B41DEF1|nr:MULTISPECIES: RluA family pseudouridine synthase [unclassified Pigmentiphaga]MDH2235682.1 RluA family pseudouridine synthase [Pigmentiphaga sp. GD03639]OVZ59256.1 RNA pseudouridine synthase [Pigmentiphaga sp. NML030171]